MSSQRGTIARIALVGVRQCANRTSCHVWRQIHGCAGIGQGRWSTRASAGCMAKGADTIARARRREVSALRTGLRAVRRRLCHLAEPFPSVLEDFVFPILQVDERVACE